MSSCRNLNHRARMLNRLILVNDVCHWRGISSLISARQQGLDVLCVNLVGRIEKLEEDVRSYATIVRVLSRQLEKLGIRFWVTRKALKEPISQAANLAQKNSEATRALAMQEDILEKELGEIQKVLLAMQEQQHKQLELILAIGKSWKLFENRQEPPNQAQAQSTLDMSNFPDGTKQMEAHGTEALGSRKGSNNDRT